MRQGIAEILLAVSMTVFFGINLGYTAHAVYEANQHACAALDLLTGPQAHYPGKSGQQFENALITWRNENGCPP